MAAYSFYHSKTPFQNQKDCIGNFFEIPFYTDQFECSKWIGEFTLDLLKLSESIGECSVDKLKCIFNESPVNIEAVDW